MTQEGFNGLPLLLARAQLVECGIPETAIEDLKWEVTAGRAEVPAGKIGWVVFNGSRQGKYRKSDVAALIGLKVK